MFMFMIQYYYRIVSQQPPVARITYTVLVETLNHAQSINQSQQPHLSSDSKHVTLNDFETSFCVKFCFALIHLEFRSLALSKLGHTLTCSECRWRTLHRKE